MALSRNIQRAFLNSKHTQEIAESQGKDCLTSPDKVGVMASTLRLKGEPQQDERPPILRRALLEASMCPMRMKMLSFAPNLDGLAIRVIFG